MKITLLLSLILLLSACSLKEVKPWEKKTLAEDTMQYEGIHPEMKKFESHIYYSKESSRGGSGVGGGGCGCN
jgi:outer membrane biogenesis lipoprotein LolB